VAGSAAENQVQALVRGAISGRDEIPLRGGSIPS
jgi:hypothetical protein